MGDGVNKDTVKELIDLEPTALLDLFVIYYKFPEDDFNFVAISPSSNGIENGIIWQGVQYLPVPIETEGFRTIGESELPKPKIRVSNKDFFASRYISRFKDLVGAKVIRKRVFAKFLDDKNFIGGNPFNAADPEAGMPDEIYYINRKSAETKSLMEFELVTPLEMENYKIPNRAGFARYCYWSYRGYGCRYAGVPITNTQGEAFTGSLQNKGAYKVGISYNVNDFVFIESKSYLLINEDEIDPANPTNQKGLRTFYVCLEAHTADVDDFPPFSLKWAKDACLKSVNACSSRFGTNLPFGGFPGTYEYKTQIPT
jgi:lambda family phage minor tail protein L